MPCSHAFRHLRFKLLAITLSLIATSLIALGTPRLAFADTPEQTSIDSLSYRGFVDVESWEWYVTSGDLDYAVDNGLFSGYDDGTNRFGPIDPVTRGQVAVILHRIAGEPHADASNFSDVNYEWFYGDAIEWARSTGVINGYDDGTNRFGPEVPVTREQLAVMLSNYAAKIEKLDTATDGKALDAILGADMVSGWARNAMGWAVDNSILSGVVLEGTAYVEPQGTAQRCQAVKMMSVFHRDVLELGYKDDNPGGPEDMPDLDEPTSIVLNKDVINIENNIRSASVTDTTASIIVNGDVNDVTAGDIVMLPASTSLPFGIALQVTSISHNGDRTTVTGIKPDMNEVYDEVWINEDISMDDLAGTKKGGVETQSEILGYKKFTVSHDFGKGFGTIEGSITVEDLQGHIKYFGIEPFAYTDIEIDGDITFDVEVKLHAIPSSARKVKIESIPVPYASLTPLGTGLYINVYMNVDIAGTVTLTAEYAIEGSVQQRWLPDLDVDGGIRNTKFEIPELSITGKLGPSIVAAVQVGGWPAVDAGAEAGFDAKAKKLDHPDLDCIDVNTWVYSETFGEIAGENTDALKITCELWTEDNSPFNWNIHFENGRLVPECTWEEKPSEPEEPSEPDENSEFIYTVGDYVLNDTVGSGSLRTRLGELYPSSDIHYEKLGRRVRWNQTPKGQHSTSDNPSGGTGSSGEALSTAWECGNGVYITGYKGSSPNVTIPRQINGIDVVYVGIAPGSNARVIQSLDVSQAKQLKVLEVYPGSNMHVEFGSIPSLEHIQTAMCSFTGDFDSSGCANVKTISFGDGTYFGTGVGFSVDNLEEFGLAMSNITGTFSFGNAPKLREVSFAFTPITELAIGSAPNLESLTIEGTNISHLNIGEFPKLSYLWVADNKISDVSALEAWLDQPGHSGGVYAGQPY